MHPCEFAVLCENFSQVHPDLHQMAIPLRITSPKALKLQTKRYRFYVALTNPDKSIEFVSGPLDLVSRKNRPYPKRTRRRPTNDDDESSEETDVEQPATPTKRRKVNESLDSDEITSESNSPNPWATEDQSVGTNTPLGIEPIPALQLPAIIADLTPSAPVQSLESPSEAALQV